MFVNTDFKKSGRVNQLKIVLKVDDWYERHGLNDHVDLQDGFF